jgi:hypothetical protein
LQANDFYNQKFPFLGNLENHPAHLTLDPKTPLSLLKKRQSLRRTELDYNRMRTLERKQDTRAKIQFGGLIKKAGLDQESSAVLLGLLLKAKEELDGENGNSFRTACKVRGDLAFLEHEAGENGDYSTIEEEDFLKV